MSYNYLDHVKEYCLKGINEGLWDRFKKKNNTAKTAANNMLAAQEAKKQEAYKSSAYVIEMVVEGMIKGLMNQTGVRLLGLPTGWKSKGITVYGNPKSSDVETGDLTENKKSLIKESVYIPSNFIKLFWGRYDKGRTFTKHVGYVSFEMPDGKSNKAIEIWWRVEDSFSNFITIKGNDVSDDGKVIPNTTTNSHILFEFHDHDIDPRTESGKNFSIEKIFSKANENSENIIKYFSPHLKHMEKDFQKALFNVTIRKSMEWKHKNDPMLKPQTNDEEGESPEIEDYEEEVD